MKGLKKNKKGFTLVEVIVVLLIVGILLAITIPSIMGYVGKAKDAQYEAEGRSGFFAAQTILADEVSGISIPTVDADKTLLKGKLEGAITANAVGRELGEVPSSDKTNAGATIKAIKCEVNVTTVATLKGCSIQTSGTGEGTGKKWVNFTAGTDTTAPEVTVDTTATYPITTPTPEA